mmetsp:Transcript_27504/g.34180  ORF Transcript_27504/g.34180 Transcript_27504/m.34180 type:complete len:80 (-) Transcript_27504:288-527(-)
MANDEGELVSPKDHFLPTLKIEDLSIKLKEPKVKVKSKTPLKTATLMNKNVVEKLVTRQHNSRVFERLSHLQTEQKKYK